MTRRILVALDDTESSQTAVHFVEQFFAHDDVEVLGINVAELHNRGSRQASATGSCSRPTGSSRQSESTRREPSRYAVKHRPGRDDSRRQHDGRRRGDRSGR